MKKGYIGAVALIWMIGIRAQQAPSLSDLKKQAEKQKKEQKKLQKQNSKRLIFEPTRFETLDELVQAVSTQESLPSLLEVFYDPIRAKQYSCGLKRLSMVSLLNAQPAISRKLMSLQKIESLAHVPGLQALDLSGHVISSFSIRQLLGVLPCLRYLNLSRNSITTLTKSQLAALPSNFTLILDHNPISTIEPNAFDFDQAACIRNTIVSLKGVALSSSLQRVLQRDHTFCAEKMVAEVRSLLPYMILLYGLMSAYSLSDQSQLVWPRLFTTMCTSSFFYLIRGNPHEHSHVKIITQNATYAIPRCGSFPRGESDT